VKIYEHKQVKNHPPNTSEPNTFLLKIKINNQPAELLELKSRNKKCMDSTWANSSGKVPRLTAFQSTPAFCDWQTSW
jgi:hypothetical protein